MIFRTYTPSKPLSILVERFWYWKSGPAAHAWDRMMPSPEMGLIINLEEDEIRWRTLDGYHGRARGIAITGAQSGPFEIDTRQQRHVIGVEFRIGGAIPILRADAGVPANHHVSLEEFWGRDTRFLHERLVETDDVEQRFAILEAWLLKKSNGQMECDPLLSEALVLLDRTTVRETARTLGMSQKKLARCFGLGVGVLPKEFHRVQRFKRLLNSVHLEPNVAWADEAQSQGYYDQAHLIHEFRRFSGFAPEQYLRLRGEHLNHVPLPA